MTGVWVEIGIAGAACIAALIKRAEIRESRNADRYTPRHSR